MTTTLGEVIDNENPTNQSVGLGSLIKDVQDVAPVIFIYNQTTAANAAAQTVLTAPFPMRIVDIIVEGRASEAAVVTFDNGTTAIATAITAADKAVSHLAAGVTAAELDLAVGDTVTMQTGHADSRAHVTVIGMRI